MVEDLLKRAEEILTRRFQAEKDWELLQLERELRGMEPAPAQPKPKKKKRLTANEKFIRDYEHLLEPPDIEFLSKRERTSTEVTEYFGWDDRNKATKMLRDKKGPFEPGPTDNPGGNRRMFDTLSVVKYMIGFDAETQEKQDRNLHPDS